MLYQQMYNAIIEKDMDTIRKIFDNEFVLLYINDRNMNKNECLSAIKGGGWIVAYSNVNYDDIVITVNGNYATLCGKSYVNIENKSGGKKNDLYIQ